MLVRGSEVKKYYIILFLFLLSLSLFSEDEKCKIEKAISLHKHIASDKQAELWRKESKKTYSQFKSLFNSPNKHQSHVKKIQTIFESDLEDSDWMFLQVKLKSNKYFCIYSEDNSSLYFPIWYFRSGKINLLSESKSKDIRSAVMEYIQMLKSKEHTKQFIQKIIADGGEKVTDSIDFFLNQKSVKTVYDWEKAYKLKLIAKRYSRTEIINSSYRGKSLSHTVMKFLKNCLKKDIHTLKKVEELHVVSGFISSPRITSFDIMFSAENVIPAVNDDTLPEAYKLVFVRINSKDSLSDEVAYQSFVSLVFKKRSDGYAFSKSFRPNYGTFCSFLHFQPDFDSGSESPVDSLLRIGSDLEYCLLYPLHDYFFRPEVQMIKHTPYLLSESSYKDNVEKVRALTEDKINSFSAACEWLEKHFDDDNVTTFFQTQNFLPFTFIHIEKESDLKELEHFCQDSSWRVRARLASKEGLNSHIVDKLIADKDWYVRKQVATCQPLTKAQASSLAKDKSTYVRLALATRNSPMYTKGFVNEKDLAVIFKLVNNPKISTEVLNSFTWVDNPKILHKIAGHTNCSRQLLTDLFNKHSNNLDLKFSLISNSNCPDSLRNSFFKKMESEENISVLRKLAHNKYTPPELLTALYSKNNQTVNKLLALNSNTPKSILKKLGEDWQNYSLILLNENCPEEVFVMVAVDLNSLSLGKKASLCQNPSTPERILLKLAEFNHDYLRSLLLKRDKLPKEVTDYLKANSKN